MKCFKAATESEEILSIQIKKRFARCNNIVVGSSDSRGRRRWKGKFILSIHSLSLSLFASFYYDIRLRLLPSIRMEQHCCFEKLSREHVLKVKSRFLLIQSARSALCVSPFLLFSSFLLLSLSLCRAVAHFSTNSSSSFFALAMLRSEPAPKLFKEVFSLSLVCARYFHSIC